MARPVGKASISFGLVNIPVKVYTAVGSKTVSFNMLHKGCGSRVQQRMFCPVDNATVEREDIARGYEHSRGQYVMFTEEELKSLESARTNTIELLEFVPASSIDFLFIESTHYLGADGSDRAYQLLSQALTRSARIAVGRYATRGKDLLVLIRPYQKGLILHEAFYADEVRSFEDSVDFATMDLAPMEHELADAVIGRMSAERFDPSKYEDKWRKTVEAAVEQKVAGQEVAVHADAPKAQIIDLLEALKRSVEKTSEAVAAANDEKIAPPAPPSARPGPAKVKAAKKERTKKRSAG